MNDTVLVESSLELLTQKFGNIVVTKPLYGMAVGILHLSDPLL